MKLTCARCCRVLEFSGDKPSFCAYCGKALSDAQGTDPAVAAAEAVTVLPGGPPAGQPADAPQTLGCYRLLRRLGQGGMGTVFEAEETPSGRRVALKWITPELADSGDALERFRQEGRIASMIAHPRCVFVLAVDEQAGQPYIVMELMPGATLKDLVDERGPLPPDQAIAKILDVIAGLQEAHRLDVIHRDVKPSNCFLDADGRVKVGDFGLAKSVVKDAHLTKSGAFVGTPHFASPEQVKSEPINPQTDVYSVAATLYYLLTGVPPFEGNDSMSTLARIVADPAPSLLLRRPDLSPALDRVILRGLERDRSLRWPDLDSFCQALLALTPDRLTLPGLGRRLAAYLLDVLLVWLAVLGVERLLQTVLPGTGTVVNQAQALAGAALAGLGLFALYFTVTEAAWGCSLGKRLLRLRVCTLTRTDPPGWGRAALRAVACFGLLHLGSLAAALVLPALARPGASAADWRAATAGTAAALTWGWLAVGLAALAAPMRAGCNYRGLHEILSGTRVAPWPRPPQSPPLLDSGGWLLSLLQGRRLSHGSGQPGGLPERLAGFKVRGALKWTEGEKILLGEDAALGRRVFILLRPLAEAPLDQARRDVGRRTRLRWLACGRQGELQWDAILAPAGCPLPEYVRSEGSLSWPESRPLLEELTGELIAALDDHTLPGLLSTALVWVQRDGRVQLADTALTAAPSEEAPPEAATDTERGLALLRQVAALALEGRPRRPDEAARPIQAALPPPARRTLGRLTGAGPPYQTLREWQADLTAAGTD